jgi:hypothetical protein
LKSGLRGVRKKEPEPEDELRPEGEKVYVRLNRGGGKEAVVDLKHWRCVQQRKWFLCSTHGSDCAAAYVLDDRAFQHVLLLGAYIVMVAGHS